MRYRRSTIAGGTFFFTTNLADRSADLLTAHAATLRSVVRVVKQRHPFDIEAMVVLPDHLHAIWTLPPGDSDYASRWGLIKAGFSRNLPVLESRSQGRRSRGERGIWQRRFWEHRIVDDEDFARHVDYIHYNPVKHGHANSASDWPYSSIHRYVRNGLLPDDWGRNLPSEPTGTFGERK